LSDFPEFILSTTATSKAIARAVEANKLREIGSRLYTSNLRENPVDLVKRKIWDVVAVMVPNAVIVDRTAFEQRPASDGSVFLVGTANREIELPGVKLKVRKGVRLSDHDQPMRSGLYMSSHARTLVENMVASRARSGVSRTVSREEVESFLLNRLRNDRNTGHDGLGILRDQIRVVGKALGLEENAAELDGMIGTLLGTKEVELTSPVAISHKLGTPYDDKRVDLFNKIHDVLIGRAPAAPRVSRENDQGLLHEAFFESYFSNFIEGTEFEIEEAEDIIFGGRIPNDRPADAHDILGTFDIVSSREEMMKTPKDTDELINLLKRRHAQMMSGRPETMPGQFKTKSNRFGGTSFVHPDEVLGTLDKGFEIYNRLTTPFDRAVFMMFMVAEVHPFVDGNGRSARIMMNAELASAKESRIIIPTIYRSNYLEGLSLMTNHGDPDTLIKTLDFTQRYVHSFDWSNFDQSRKVLEKTHAFIRPEDGDRNGIRLRLPRASDFAPENNDNDGDDGSGGGASGGVSRQRGIQTDRKADLSKEDGPASERKSEFSNLEDNKPTNFTGQLRQFGANLWSGLNIGNGEKPNTRQSRSRSEPERIVEALGDIIGPVLDQHLAEIRVFRRGGGGGGQRWDGYRTVFETLQTELDRRYLRGGHLLELAVQQQLDRVGTIEKQEGNLLSHIVRKAIAEPLDARRVFKSMATYPFEDAETVIADLRMHLNLASETLAASASDYSNFPQPGKTVKERILDLKDKVAPKVTVNSDIGLKPRF
jgi:hypothetical protein